MLSSGRTVGLLALICGLVGLLAPGAARAVGPNPAIADPSATGPYGFVRVDYDMPKMAVVGVGKPGSTVTASGTLLKMREAGDLFYPASGSGPFPVLIFEHGNHATCQSGPASTLGLEVDPGDFLSAYSNGSCTTGSATVDQLLSIQEAKSYTGYDYIAQQLATQGYIVASLDVNDITNWDNNENESGYLARAEIISKTLDLISSWNRSPGPPGVGTALEGRVDIARVGVMGHSRGGEGVNEFDEYNQTRPATKAQAARRMDPENPKNPEPVPDFGPRYHLLALFSLAPVDGQGGRYPTVTNTNFATMFGYCDGDVFDLEGARVFERSQFALTSHGDVAAQYLINGANHDYFNTVWTEDDADEFGFGDPNCEAEAGPTRLQPAEQRQIALTIIPAFLRYFVGGEKQFKPIIDGDGLPPVACPRNPATNNLIGVTCDNVVQTSYEAPDRRLLIGPTTLPPATASDRTPAGDAVTYSGFITDPPVVCEPQALAPVNTAPVSSDFAFATTGCGSTPNRSDGPQLTFAWAGPASVEVTLEPRDQNVSSFGALTFRASEDYLSPLQLPIEDDVYVTLTDTNGHKATVSSSDYSAALLPEPGTTARKQILNGVRIPLTAFIGGYQAPDLTKIKTITLGFGSADSLTGSIQFSDLELEEPTSDDGIPPAGPASGPVRVSGPGSGKQTCSAPGHRITVPQDVRRPLREIRAVVMINGRVVARYRGHAIRRVRFHRPAGRSYALTVIATLSDGEVVGRQVTYTGCRGSNPIIYVITRARRHHRGS
jgi:hypothetical protein